MTRATFDLTLAGDPAAVAAAVEELAERLTEAGHFLDEGFDFLHNEQRCTGLRLYTAAAARCALERLPEIGAYMLDLDEAETIHTPK